MRISDCSSDVCSPDLGRRRVAALHITAQIAWLIIANIDPRYQVRRSTHEPGIGRAVGRAGLAEQRPVHVTQPLRRAAGYYAFGDMNDLICCHRVHKLAPRRLEARHGPAVPVGLVAAIAGRSEEHTSELQSLMRHS